MSLEEKLYEVYWRGPFTPKNIVKKIDNDDVEKYVLYKIYGSHPLYGKDVLLYIGMTEQGIKERLKQHDYWMDTERYGKSKIYVASIGEFKDWKTSNDIAVFNRPERALTEQIESLLIYSHQPAMNIKNKKTAKNAKGIRVFNTGEFGALMPEISGFYHYL